MAGDALAELRRAHEMVTKLPLTPRRIIARHDVPYGRCLKQWMTNGDLIVWANRGELCDMPHRKAPTERISATAPLFGIPVVFE